MGTRGGERVTCVVAIVDNDGVFMASDSNAVVGNTVFPRADKKMFTIRSRYGTPMLLGFTSSYRMGQLLRWWTPPDRGTMDVEQYIHTKFIEGVRNQLKTGGYTRVSDNREEGGTFLVAYHDRLFEVHNDFQIAMPGIPYSSIGSGREFALGSLYTTQGGILSTEARAVVAVESAAQFSASVGGDIDTMRLGVVR